MKELDNKSFVGKGSHKKEAIHEQFMKAKENVYKNSFHKPEFMWFKDEETANKFKEAFK